MHSFTIIELPETVSTNDYVARFLKDNPDSSDMVFTAHFQNQGKGQGNNTWISEYGKNLLCSIVLSPWFIHPQKQFILSKITSMALIELLQGFSLRPLIKWPNDIIVKGSKIAGVLIENTLIEQRISKSVIGVGLNVNQLHFPGLTKPATSILSETGDELKPGEVLEALLEKFEFWYHKAEMGHWDEIDLTYLENLYGLNRELLFRMGDREFRATVMGVGESGKLFLQRDDGKIIKAAFREIEFL